MDRSNYNLSRNQKETSTMLSSEKIRLISSYLYNNDVKESTLRTKKDLTNKTK